MAAAVVETALALAQPNGSLRLAQGVLARAAAVAELVGAVQVGAAELVAVEQLL
jgi:hypothetical protein